MVFKKELEKDADNFCWKCQQYKNNYCRVCRGSGFKIRPIYWVLDKRWRKKHRRKLIDQLKVDGYFLEYWK